MAFYAGDQDTTIVFNHHYSGEEFIVEPGFLPDSIAIDPELWLITGNNQYTLGVEDLTDPPVSVYPNPVTDRITISFPQNGFTIITLMDLQGKTIVTFSPGSVSSYQLNLSNYASGLYFILIETDSHRYLEKVLKH